MSYLISQILVSLLFTGALGVIAGWLIRGVGVRAQLAAVEREREQERQRASAQEDRAALAENVTPQPADTDETRQRAVDARQESAARAALVGLRERLGQLDTVARTQAERIADLGQRLREKDALLDRLQPVVDIGASAHAPKGRTTLPPPRGLLVERPGHADRLQAISGIGPVLERVLNELGIYRFHQLARLTPDNIEWLASRIDWFPQRIQREDWVGQARRLHEEAHPDEEL